MSLTQTWMRWNTRIGADWLNPFIRICTGESPAAQWEEITRRLVIPLLAVGAFLAVWGVGASRIDTSLGTFPTPATTWQAARDLHREYQEERERKQAYAGLIEEKRASHVAAQQRRQEAYAADGRSYTPRPYSSPPYAPQPTFPGQILTSLKTVFAGFLLASVIAIPVGILCGLSTTVQTALNPLIQIFKPVSPLAWLPLVTLVISAAMTAEEAPVEKSFVISALTVSLCSLWPTLINTSLGVASVSQDHLNVARVLNLAWHTRILKIVLPSALPMVFAGLRISLGIGWMVLIAAEMLAQNPGLGKFVWDMFQNGSSQTLSMIMVAIITIGIIGFLLDRVMLTLQHLVSFDQGTA